MLRSGVLQLRDAQPGSSRSHGAVGDRSSDACDHRLNRRTWHPFIAAGAKLARPGDVRGAREEARPFIEAWAVSNHLRFAPVVTRAGQSCTYSLRPCFVYIGPVSMSIVP